MESDGETVNAKQMVVLGRWIFFFSEVEARAGSGCEFWLTGGAAYQGPHRVGHKSRRGATEGHGVPLSVVVIWVFLLLPSWASGSCGVATSRVTSRSGCLVSWMSVGRMLLVGAVSCRPVRLLVGALWALRARGYLTFLSGLSSVSARVFGILAFCGVFFSFFPLWGSGLLRVRFCSCLFCFQASLSALFPLSHPIVPRVCPRDLDLTTCVPPSLTHDFCTVHHKWLLLSFLQFWQFTITTLQHW